jgi:hypothetical protein
MLDLSAAEYDDLEQHADEWRTVIPFFKVKFLIRLLDIDASEIFERKAETSSLQSAKLSTLIRSRRSELGLTPDQFSNRVGFYPDFCGVIEGHPLGLELYPLQVAVLVAQVLNIPSDELLHRMTEG